MQILTVAGMILHWIIRNYIDLGKVFAFKKAKISDFTIKFKEKNNSFYLDTKEIDVSL